MIFLKESEKIGVIYNDKQISYTEITRYAKSFAQKIDIKKEDKVVIFMENRPELLYSFFGVWDKEGTCVTIDASFTGEELEYYLTDCRPKYIFTSKENFSKAEKGVSLANLDYKLEIIVVDDIPMDYEGENPTVSLDDKDMVAIMLYTSGTTGKPKGVMLTLDNLFVNMEGLDEYNMYQESDRILGLLPMHHILPLLGSGILPLVKGATLVFLKEVSSQAMVEALQKYKITFIVGVPKLWEMLHKKIMAKINSSKATKTVFSLAKKINNKNIRKKIFKKVHEGFGGNIRFFVSGGSKLDPQVSADFLTLGIDVCEGYGLTETAPMISFTPVNHIVPGSAGKLLKGIEVKIAEDGEIIVKGRNVMKGYYNKPEATAEVIDKDGWFHTGDLGELKGEWIFVTGRKKEMIVLSNGKNINPIEIEKYIEANSDNIKEVAVMEYEGKLTALIHPDFYKINEAEITNILESFKLGIIDIYNKQAPNYKKILDVKIVKEELPKTKIGKLRRFMLKDLIEKKEEVNLEFEEPTTEEYQKISKFIKNLKNKMVIPDAHLELDLAMDSLDIVELLSYIEGTFGVKVDEKALAANATVETLAAYVGKHSHEITDTKVRWNDLLSKDPDHELPKSNFVGKIVKFILMFAFTFYVRISKFGREKTKHKEPVLFVGNHQSFLDGFMLCQALPNNILDNTYFFAKVDYFRKGYMKFMGDNSNIILVDINKNLVGSMQMLAKALRSGKNIMIFPEGTRTRDGKLGKFKKFFAILSKELNIPVVPFVIKGAYETYPPNAKYPKAGKVSITFLDKVSPDSTLNYQEYADKIRSIISEELNK